MPVHEEVIEGVISASLADAQGTLLKVTESQTVNIEQTYTKSERPWIEQLHWAAGLIEGEGCFSYTSQSPVIHVGSTDLDVLQDLHNFLHCGNVHGPYKRIKRFPNAKPFYQFVASGTMAVGWMLTLYSLMKSRRRSQIQKVVKRWRETGTNKSTVTQIWRRCNARA